MNKGMVYRSFIVGAFSSLCLCFIEQGYGAAAEAGAALEHREPFLWRSVSSLRQATFQETNLDWVPQLHYDMSLIESALTHALTAHPTANTALVKFTLFLRASERSPLQKVQCWWTNDVAPSPPLLPLEDAAPSSPASSRAAGAAGGSALGERGSAAGGYPLAGQGFGAPSPSDVLGGGGYLLPERGSGAVAAAGVGGGSASVRRVPAKVWVKVRGNGKQTTLSFMSSGGNQGTSAVAAASAGGGE